LFFNPKLRLYDSGGVGGGPSTTTCS